MVLATVSVSACIPSARSNPLAPTAMRGATVRVLRAGATAPFVGVVELATSDSLVVRADGREVALHAKEIDRLQMPELPAERRTRAAFVGGTVGLAAAIYAPFLVPSGGAVTTAASLGVLVAAPLVALAALPVRYRDAVLPSRLQSRGVAMLVPDDGYPEPVGGQRVRVVLGGAMGTSTLVGSLSMRGRDSLDVYDPELGDHIIVSRADVLQVAVSRGRIAATQEEASLAAGRTIGVVVLTSLLSPLWWGADRGTAGVVIGTAAVVAGGMTIWAMTRERWVPAVVVGAPEQPR
jgi:hypothetical protein